jgi:hypothetical protein
MRRFRLSQITYVQGIVWKQAERRFRSEFRLPHFVSAENSSNLQLWSIL